MVGRPGIEPGVGLPDGVTVRCRTLRRPALILWWEARDSNSLTVSGTGLQPVATLQLDRLPKMVESTGVEPVTYAMPLRRSAS